MYLLGFGHKSLPSGRFSCGIYWPKTTCVKKKKSFEILPDNHYGIFEKTQCPWVNETLQAVGLASGENSFALNCFIALFVLCCFDRAGRVFISVSSPPRKLIKGKWRWGIVKRPFPRGAGKFWFLWTRTSGHMCLRSSQVAEHLGKNNEIWTLSASKTADMSMCRIWYRRLVLVGTS